MRRMDYTEEVQGCRPLLLLFVLSLYGIVDNLRPSLLPVHHLLPAPGSTCVPTCSQLVHELSLYDVVGMLTQPSNYCTCVILTPENGPKTGKVIEQHYSIEDIQKHLTRFSCPDASSVHVRLKQSGSQVYTYSPGLVNKPNQSRWVARHRRSTGCQVIGSTAKTDRRSRILWVGTCVNAFREKFPSAEECPIGKVWKSHLHCECAMPLSL